MKKFLLPLVVALISLASCTDYTDDFNTINNRLDALEQAVPSIEEQIESINTQLSSLKATDEAIKEQIDELEKSDKATASEIADLKKKDSALEKSINDLQNYVDTQIANAKSEAAAAYATVEQYNTIVAQLGALQSSTSKLGEELTAKINAEVKSLTDKIADLEARLKAVEDKVENLLARIQSVSYIPTYNDNKATLKYISGASQVMLDFKVSPKECVAELEKVWQDAVHIDAVYTETRAVSFIDMPIVKFEADAENGVISVIASGENLSEGFFAGTQSASVALTISDGNSSVTSEYVPMVAKLDSELGVIIPTNEIWYTSTDGKIVTPYKSNVFDANIVSNTYENGQGVITFDGDVTQIGEVAFCYCETLKSITIPDSVTTIGDGAFVDCISLEAFYGKFTSLDNRCLVINNTLIAFALGCGATNYTISNGITAIGGGAMRSCYSITNLTITDTVVSIGEEAICNCTSLETIKLSNNITKIDDWAFFNCTALKSINIPNSITAIGNGLFAECSSLISITIPNSVTSIGEQAFLGCSSLTTFYGKFASADNRCLIIDGVLNSFAQSGLTKYTIPNGVTSIGDDAFHGCSSLKEVYCRPITPPTGRYNMFYGNASGRKIYVPIGSGETYKAKSYWSDYADSIEEKEF